MLLLYLVELVWRNSLKIVCFFFSIKDIPFVFVVGEGLLFPKLKTRFFFCFRQSESILFFVTIKRLFTIAFRPHTNV